MGWFLGPGIGDYFAVNFGSFLFWAFFRELFWIVPFLVTERSFFHVSFHFQWIYRPVGPLFLLEMGSKVEGRPFGDGKQMIVYFGYANGFGDGKRPLLITESFHFIGFSF